MRYYNENSHKYTKSKFYFNLNPASLFADYVWDHLGNCGALHISPRFFSRSIWGTYRKSPAFFPGNILTGYCCTHNHIDESPMERYKTFSQSPVNVAGTHTLVPVYSVGCAGDVLPGRHI